jgi:hypothetical protein
MFLISAPITEAPWYLLANGPLSVGSLPHVLAAVQAARYGEVMCPVLDLTMAGPVDADAGKCLAEMVDRGDLNVLGPGINHVSMAPGLAAVIRESHLEALETVVALIRRRRHEGLADSATISDLLDRLRMPGTPWHSRNYSPAAGFLPDERIESSACRSRFRPNTPP